jgi:hypothetical protein
MSNPSTIWATLSLPNPPVGSIPFVFTDNATIVTDVSNFAYAQLGATLTGSQCAYQLTVAGGLRINYQDVTNQTATIYTINKVAGRLKIPNGASSVVVNNSYCFITSFIILQIEGTDGTVTRVYPLASNGSFEIEANGSVASAGGLQVTFTIINVF